MIKHNCGGAGLTQGLRIQVGKLVEALKIACELQNIRVHLVNNNKDGEMAQTVLEPFAELTNLSPTGEMVVTGAVTESFSRELILRLGL